MVAPRKTSSQSLTTPVRPTRCAIYCRKSTDENLDSDFNSIDAQRESAEAYILSQKQAGWVALPTRYDDPAYSAATTDRPALQRLLADIEVRKLDAVVVYKIDRMSRNLRDFGRLMETFEQHGVAFVSVTQHFDTSSSMGKLTLNILMSFAEFEHAVTRERILDSVAGKKRKGMHCGGPAVLGYSTADKKLVVNAEEAKLVRRIFERYLELQSTTKLAAELNDGGFRTKTRTTATGEVHCGHEWDKADLYRLLNNVVYTGLVAHHGQTYLGEHHGIVPQALWDEAHRILEANHRARANHTRAKTPALLKGVIRCGHCDCSMGPTFTKRRGKTYPFYLCTSASKRGYKTCPIKSVAAGTIEAAVVSQLRVVLRTPEVVSATYREAKVRESDHLSQLRHRLKNAVVNGEDREALEHEIHVMEAHAITEREVTEALQSFDSTWHALFPGERARIVQLLVERVDVYEDGIELRLRADGLRSLVAELTPQPQEAAS